MLASFGKIELTVSGDKRRWDGDWDSSLLSVGEDVVNTAFGLPVDILTDRRTVDTTEANHRVLNCVDGLMRS